MDGRGGFDDKRYGYDIINGLVFYMSSWWDGARAGDVLGSFLLECGDGKGERVMQVL